MDNVWLIPVVGALGILLGAFLERFLFSRLPEQPLLLQEDRDEIVEEVKAIFRDNRQSFETALTDANRMKIVEEMGAIIDSSLPLQIKRVVDEHVVSPKGAGSLDQWYGSRSTLPPKTVFGQEEPE